MPELPEVETIRRGLQQYLVGHTIQEVYIKDRKLLSDDTIHLIDGKVEKIDRIGKGLIIVLNNGYSIAIHVKMTGQLIYQSLKTKDIALSPKVGGKLPNKYTRAIFELDSGAVLFYNDVRRFGWMKVLPSKEIGNLPFFNEMGPEPFVGSLLRASPDNPRRLTIEYFKKMLSMFNTPIKTLLMDQQRIGGIGNIYANDALWEARIDPRRKSSSLTDKEKESLFSAIHEVMEFSIEHGAASDSSYVDALGQDGRYQEHFKVYGRVGEQCDRCGAKIQRIKLGGRGTFLCPVCQN